MTISAELVDKAGLRLIGQLSKLGRSEARAMLASTGEYTEAEIIELLSLCKNTQPAAEADYYTRRRKVLAALWLLGGSWTQLGMLYEVAKQTVMQSAQRQLGSIRSRSIQRCTIGRLTEYNAAFWQNADELTSQTPQQIAQWLLSNTEED